MNVKFLSDKKIIVKVNSSYLKLDEDNLYDDLKKILINIRKKYYYDIYGFYEVNIYYVKDLLTILTFYKTDEDSFYNKTIDLKVVRSSKEPLIFIDDFQIVDRDKQEVADNKIRLNIVDKKDIYKICEHYSLETSNLQ